MKPKNCTICETKLIGTFCHECGQEVTGKRLTFLLLIKDFFANVVALEKSGIATMIHVIKTPHKVIKNFWEGNRRYYQPPSRLIVYASLIIGVHSYLHDNLIMGLAYSNQPQVGFFTLFLILFPISSFIVYFGSKNNFIEHIAANFYLFSTWSIISIISYELISLFDENITISFVTTIFLILAMLWYENKVFKPSSNFLNKLAFVLLQLITIVSLLSLIVLMLAATGQVEVQF